MKFRALRADEIDVRVATITPKGFTLLLYKDARCDMNILDETIGAMNWERTHTRENANCIVSIWDNEKQQWVSKEDTGTESFTEKEKGLASDSFKRACFNWGIGRELYTAPFIWVSDTSYYKDKGGKTTITERFKVKSIEISEDKIITSLEITDNKGNLVFSTKKSEPKKAVPAGITPAQINTLVKLKVKTFKPLEQLSYSEAKAIIDTTTKLKEADDEI